MKLIYIILLFPFLSYGQTHVVFGYAGEYTSVLYGSDNLLVSVTANTALAGISGASSGVPKEITGTGTTFSSVNTTLHGCNAVDVTGFGWVWGNNTDGEIGNGAGGIGGVINATKITLDSRGLSLGNVTMMQGTYFQNGADDIAGLFWAQHGTSSDTLQYSGVGKYGMAADGQTGSITYSTPTMTNGLPSGKRIKQMIGGIVGGYLRSDSTVWTWGGGGNAAALGRAVSGSNYAVPIQVTIPGGDPIVAIVGGGNPGILYLGVSGKLYGSSTNSGYMGNLAQTSYSTPTDLTTTVTNHIFNGITRTSIVSMGCTALGFYLIINDGSLWYMGDNDMGGAGNGFQANLASPPGDSTPWFIDPSGVLYTPIYTPQQVGNKHNWTWVSSGVNFVFQVYALDATNQLWSWGRNKGGVIPDGIIECPGDGGDLTAFYPNSWDRNWAYPVNPYTVTTATGQGCYGCKTGAVTANCHSCGSTQTPVPVISVSGTTLDGTSSHVGGSNVITKYVYSQNSGPNTAVIDAPGSPIVHLSGLISGTYVMKLQVTDNFFDSATTTVSLVVGQAGYYFAAAGSDGNACTLSSPCQTISKFNSIYATLSGGDTCYFNRGDVFAGTMRCAVSGSSGNPIVVTAYGTGKAPEIGGMTTLAGWTNVSGNVWSVPYAGVYPNLLTIDGKLASESRTPNQTTGYFIPTSMGTSTITDATNASQAPVGDSIVARVSAFTTDKRKVTVNSAGVLTVNSAFTYSGVGGNGWFVYGNLPDSATEWRDTNSTVQIYHVGTPTETYQVPTLDTILISSGTNQTFDHLHLKGASSANVILTFAAISNLVFSNDSLSCGIDGMQFRSEGAVSMINCKILHMMDDGVLKQNANNYNNIFLNDTLRDIGMIPGFGTAGNLSYYYTGLTAGDSGSVVKFCQIDSTGYHGVVNIGSGFVVDSNSISNVCQQLEDGGFVYSWKSASGTLARQAEIGWNVCHNSGGAMSHNGSSLTFASAGCGIYLDNFTSNVLVRWNTVYNGNSIGLFDHGPSNTFSNNTSYGWGFSDIFASEVTGSAVITGLTVKHNIFGSSTLIVPAVRFSTTNNDLSTFGIVDSNQVAGVPLTTQPYWTFSTGASDPGTFRTPASWTSNTGYDAHSTFQTGAPSLLYNASNASVVKPLIGGFVDLSGIKYSGSATLQPFRSLFLFNFSIGIPIPRGNRIIVL